MKTTGWAESTWTDNRLQWNPKEYGGIDRLSVDYHDVSSDDFFVIFGSIMALLAFLFYFVPFLLPFLLLILLYALCIPSEGTL